MPIDADPMNNYNYYTPGSITCTSQTISAISTTGSRSVFEINSPSARLGFSDEFIDALFDSQRFEELLRRYILDVLSKTEPKAHLDDESLDKLWERMIA